MVRVYTDYVLRYEDSERAIRDWFATRRDYEEFRSLHPDESPRFYLEEAGEFAARYLGEGVWYLPAKVALGIAAVLMMEDIGWIPEGSFHQELLRELNDAEKFDSETPEGMRLLYSEGEEE
jgi:hypothetical protein